MSGALTPLAVQPTDGTAVPPESGAAHICRRLFEPVTGRRCQAAPPRIIVSRNPSCWVAGMITALMSLGAHLFTVVGGKLGLSRKLFTNNAFEERWTEMRYARLARRHQAAKLLRKPGRRRFSDS